MNSVSSRDAIARIQEAARAEPGGAIAFDADGTLWSGDVGDDFFRGFLALGKVNPPAVLALLALAKAHDVSVPPDGPALAAAVYDAYVKGIVPEEPICEMVAYACAGFAEEDVQRLARDVVTRGDLGARLHGETAAVLGWAKEAGIEVFVVSASPRAVVLEGLRLLPVDPSHALAATPVVSDGILLAEVHRPIPYGAGKVTRLEERLGKRPLYAAFGDNVFDIPMLRRAELAFAVRPKPRLLERAADVPGLLALDPRE